MPYTLMMGLAWFVAAFVLGVVVGVVLRSVTARRQVERARAAATPTGPAVTTARVAELEDELAAMRAERDRWLAERPAADVAGVTDITGVTGVTDVRDVPGGTPLHDERADDRADERTDDLTVIVGLAPHVAELCHGIGIHTFADLAATEVSLLRTLLDDAGPRWRVHDPTSWPEQARLLDEGRHDELATFVADLRSAGSGTESEREDTTVSSPERGGLIG